MIENLSGKNLIFNRCEEESNLGKGIRLSVLRAADSYLGSRDLPPCTPAVTHLSEELTTKSPNEKETDVGLLEKALLSKDESWRL